MKAERAQQIDGDVAVGRNVIAGGNAKIRGNVKVGHDLKVEGWLEAPNIKGANKGLFKIKEDLDAAYPYPEPGWIALVGTSLPADVYIANKDGKWVPAGGKSGEVVMDLSGLDELDERIDEIENAVVAERERAEAAENEIAASVEAERERAKIAESAIEASVVAEKARAEAAEAALSDAVAALGIKVFARSFESVDDDYMIQYLEDSRNDGSVYYIDDEDAFYRQNAGTIKIASDYMAGIRPRQVFYRSTDDNLLYRHDGQGLVLIADEKMLAAIQKSIQAEREKRQDGDQALKKMLEDFKAKLEADIAAERERAVGVESELQNSIDKNAALLAEANIRVFDRIIFNRNILLIPPLEAGEIVYSIADNAFYRYFKKADLDPLALGGGSTSKGQFWPVTDYMDGDVPDASILFKMRSTSVLYRYDVATASLVRYSDSLMAGQPGTVYALTPEESEAIAQEVFGKDPQPGEWLTGMTREEGEEMAKEVFSC